MSGQEANEHTSRMNFPSSENNSMLTVLIMIASWYRRKIPLTILKYLSFTLFLLNTTYLVLANSVNPDQLASEEANWSGSALFVIKYVNFYQKPGSSILIGLNLEVGVAS